MNNKGKTQRDSQEIGSAHVACYGNDALENVAIKLNYHLSWSPPKVKYSSHDLQRLYNLK